MNTSGDSFRHGAAPGAQTGHCARCGRTLAAGQGALTADGSVCCAACAAAGTMAVAARPPSRRTSRAAIPVPPKAPADPELAPLEPQAPPPKQFPVPLAIGIGVFSFGVVFLIGVLIMRSREPEARADPAPAQRPVTTVTPPAPVAPPERKSAPDTAPGRKPEEARRPVTTSEPAPVTPTIQTPVTPPPPPPPPKKADVPVEQQVKEFAEALKKAAELADANRFSAATKTLSDLKAKYSGAAWWPEKLNEFSKAEGAVQQQLADYNTEVGDVVQQVEKSSDVKFLEQTAATWRTKAGVTGGESGRWVVPEIASMKADSGATLTRQNDGAILVSGAGAQKDRYTVVTRTFLGGITAVRLEALPHPSLPGGGPGRSGNGNFALSTFAVQAGPFGDPTKAQPVTLTNPTQSYAQGNNDVAKTVDDKQDTWWDVHPNTGRQQVAGYRTAAPTRFAGGTSLTFTLEFQTGHADHNLGCFRLLVTSAANPPDANAAAGDVSLSGGAGAADELAAKAALRVVLAAGKALDRLAEQAAQKKLADLTQQIDDVEKQLKYKSRNVEPLLKTLDAALAACNENRMIGEKLIERVAGLRFDAKLGADGELGFYNTTVKSSGAAAEILYDFSTPEQYAAWTLDSPNKDAGAAEHDQKAGTVNVTTRGKHQWDGRDRRDTPVVRLPFFLRGDTWSYEANVVLVSDGNKKDKPDYGILVWDGGGISVRCSVKAFTARDVEALIAAGTPKKDNHWGKTHMAGTTKEWLRMRMTCLGGTVTCTVTSLTTGKTVTLTMKEPIGFEPKYAGFFVRTNDDGENAKAAFSKVRLSGPVNKEKLKEKLDAERLTAVTAAKNEFAKKWGGK